jgi:hypothetical protein
VVVGLCGIIDPRGESEKMVQKRIALGFFSRSIMSRGENQSSRYESITSSRLADANDPIQ